MVSQDWDVPMLCSTKGWLGSVFSSQAKTLTCRCQVVYSNTQMLHPLWGFSKPCSWCTSLAVPAHSQLSLREGCSGKALQDITFSWAFMFREKLPHQAGNLSCCGPSAHLLLPSSTTSPWSPIFWLPSSPLSCLKSALKTVFLFLPVFPSVTQPQSHN